MAIAESEIPSKEVVYSHMRGVDPRYRPCKGGNHHWDMTDAQGYSASGRKFRGSDPRDAAWFECTDTCLIDSDKQRGCGRQRSYQMEWNSHIQDLVRTTEYTYSNMHPDLVSPRGISYTGINARTDMPDIERSEKIRRATLQLAKPTKGVA